MGMETTRAAIYLRVSTDRQTTENQSRELYAIVVQRGWIVTAVYEDAGISGAKGREQRPGLDALLKDAGRGKFDVAMAWSVDRLGRSLPDLLATMSALQAAGADLYLHQQGVDTRTPAGRAMFGMLGVFAEFERSLLRERVIAGLDRARARGVRLGPPRTPEPRLAALRAELARGTGLHKAARLAGTGVSTAQRIRREMAAQGGVS